MLIIIACAAVFPAVLRLLWDKEDYEESTLCEVLNVLGMACLGGATIGCLATIPLDYDEYTTTSTTYEIKGTKEDTDYWQTHTKSGYRQHSSDVVKLYYKKYGTWRPHTIPFDERYIKFIDSNEPPTLTVHKHEKADTFYNNWIVLAGFKTKYTYTIKGLL